MPIEVLINNKIKWLYPTNSWKEINIKNQTIEIDRDYYILSKNLNN